MPKDTEKVIIGLVGLGAVGTALYFIFKKPPEIPGVSAKISEVEVYK